MSEPQLFRAQGDGVELQLGEWPGEGRAVFCVHGLTANLRCFDLLAAGVAPRHRVLAYDLRGRGLSDKPDTGYSIGHHARDVIALLEGLGLEGPGLLGHSLGAYVALAVAAERPDLVGRLILMDGGAPLSLEQWDKVAQGIKPSVERLKIIFPSFDALIEIMKQAPLMQPWHRGLEDYFRYETVEVEGGVRSRINPDHIAEESGQLVRAEVNVYFPRVKCPVLIVRATQGMAAEDDLVLPEPSLNALLDVLPQARVVNLDDANHYSMILQPNLQRDRAILEFMAG